MDGQETRRRSKTIERMIKVLKWLALAAAWAFLIYAVITRRGTWVYGYFASLVIGVALIAAIGYAASQVIIHRSKDGKPLRSLAVISFVYWLIVGLICFFGSVLLIPLLSH